ncbi:hypothetical protein EVAR_97137_1 [Eumeta japonica]|uniref:Uncharacterized protein n=1 Tax=Eumeta variegata TaxID=151549 RepID=A0A4C1WQ67_EUMVA|nr:hypothetical protein EVAR_97137_1 [Eumeta japonica]
MLGSDSILYFGCFAVGSDLDFRDYSGLALDPNADLGVVHSACHTSSALTCVVRPRSVKLLQSSDLSSDYIA